MRRFWSAVALVLLATPAWADIASEVAEVDAALDARIAEIEALTPTRALKREAKKLRQTTAKLEVYQGTNDVKDLVVLGKALKRLYSSKTEDEGVRAEAADLVSEICAHVQTSVDAQDDAIAALLSKFTASAEAAQAKVTDLLVDCETDPEGTARVLAKAAKKLASLDKKVAQLTKKSQPKPVGLPKGIRIEATITGDGLNERVSKRPSVFSEFGVILIQGCVDPSGPEGVCRQVLVLSLGRAPDVGFNGPLGGILIDFSDSSDFQNGRGPGIADLTWQAFNPVVNITRSTASEFGGTFEVTANSFGQEPETVTIRGSFRIKRPR